MPRIARAKSETGIYHVMVRGINRQRIFLDDIDCQRYLTTLKRYKDEIGFDLYAYCLMVNHLHLLINEGASCIAHIMKRIGTSYAWWFNWRHSRSGHVFQDRFKSECIEDDAYLLTTIRYIHNNPVRAGMVTKADRYEWSSCAAYYGEKEVFPGLLNLDFIFRLFADDRNAAHFKFLVFANQGSSDEQCLEDNPRVRLNDQKAQAAILQLLNGKPISSLKKMDRAERDKFLQRAKKIEGISLRQIAKITGYGFNIVYRA